VEAELQQQGAQPVSGAPAAGRGETASGRACSGGGEAAGGGAPAAGICVLKREDAYLRSPSRATHFGFAVCVIRWTVFSLPRVVILGMGTLMPTLLEIA